MTSKGNQSVKKKLMKDWALTHKRGGEESNACCRTRGGETTALAGGKGNGKQIQRKIDCGAPTSNHLFPSRGPVKDRAPRLGGSARGRISHGPLGWQAEKRG